MKLEMVSVDSLEFDEQNAREHPPENRKLLESSLSTFGQRKPIVVTKDDVVVAGNGTLLAAKALGWSEIAIVRIPDEWSEGMVRAFAIADNRSTDLSTFDNALLSEQLGQLEIEEFDLQAVGFTPADLERLNRVSESSITATDPYAEWSGMPEYKQEDLESKFSSTVHFQSEEDRNEFFEILDMEPKKSFWWPESDGLIGSSQQEQYVVDNES
jgi:hypothetical protein